MAARSCAAPRTAYALRQLSGFASLPASPCKRTPTAFHAHRPAARPLPSRLGGSSLPLQHVRSRRASSTVAASAVAGADSLDVVVNDAALKELLADGRPLVLHCGADWLPESRRVADRLNEWSRSSDDEAAVLCVTADFAGIPEHIEKESIHSLPAVLLWRSGSVERRVDGADVAELERVILHAADVYRFPPAVSSSSTPAGTEAAMWTAERCCVAAEEAVRQAGCWSSEAEALLRQALQAGPSNHDFRARYGLLRCALTEAKAARAGSAAPSEGLVRKLTEALMEVHRRHPEELRGAREDADEIDIVLADAGLLVDSWLSTGGFDEETLVLAAAPDFSDRDKVVLQLYAAGDFQGAVKHALQNYKLAAGNDIEGLVASYVGVERPVPDAPREFFWSSGEVYHQDFLVSQVAEAPGPVAERSLLRRIFAALGPMHPLVVEALADLEFLLDQQKFVRFYTRTVHIRHGGKPKLGRGTGSRSGYSKGYWLAWGPDRLRRNNRKMNGPWTDKND
eukprot:TRINITY_DN28995_c0_g1_i1.p1 TRINITY_DN28995_c0_g1~~TRINITY_DN28995_c0_g1_i1.p1  ORF type:complete len:535 (-),score=116.65 TRINITY_DN28995_c0_g1_i1:45-1577(-)